MVAEEKELNAEGENTALAKTLLGTPEEMSTVFMRLFEGVTDEMMPSKLEELGIHDKGLRNKIIKHIRQVCSKPRNIEILTHGELPLTREHVAEWIAKRLEEEGIVYMSDSGKWYQRDPAKNKYVEIPDPTAPYRK